MNSIWITLIIVGIAYYLLSKRIGSVENKVAEDNIIPFSLKLHFNIHRAVIFSPQILNRAKVTKEELDKGYDKWTKGFKDKWYGFLKDKDSQLGQENTNFNATYLSSDNMFIIEGSSEGKSLSYVVPNRTPLNNTRLWDQTLRYYPSKDKDLRNEEIRLEVDLRSEDFDGKTMCLITVGHREFENKTLAKSKYIKLLDFPLSYPYTREQISEGELKKFGFEKKDTTPWFDKDDFGKVTAHPWDTEIVYKHESGAEISWLT
ncbi:hypothetical protein A2572_03265 [Candidatus Collierbacteria bacterium RIFOXYD1_FULL_40_9]|uniref:Uncharacterized protein n=1 Tax=Candidatus Collierbacteria bacterium RIFOXYD1_FULL_40_9 TaxID=1817731 RepID=A0A1F5FWX2_9BACT|nr:MAG: hypothetical protein A2572_03265 [Candidatus Collierbacteria bacterium RIFOXYD1_FULL_40_9]